MNNKELLKEISRKIESGDISISELRSTLKESGMSLDLNQESVDSTSLDREINTLSHSKELHNKEDRKDKKFNLNPLFYVAGIVMFMSVQYLSWTIFGGEKLTLSFVYLFLGVIFWSVCYFYDNNKIDDRKNINEFSEGLKGALIIFGSLCFASTAVYVIQYIQYNLFSSDYDAYKIAAGIFAFVLAVLHIQYAKVVSYKGYLFNAAIWLLFLSASYFINLLLVRDFSSIDLSYSLKGVAYILSFSILIVASKYIYKKYNKNYTKQYFNIAMAFIFIVSNILLTISSEAIFMIIWFFIAISLVAYSAYASVLKNNSALLVLASISSIFTSNLIAWRILDKVFNISHSELGVAIILFVSSIITILIAVSTIKFKNKHLSQKSS